MSDSDSDIAAANHRKSRKFRAPADDDVNSDDMAVSDKHQRPSKTRRKPVPSPAHSVGGPVTDTTSSSKEVLNSSSSSSSSSNSSASSPSDDETSRKAGTKSDKSASSPSDSGATNTPASRPSTSHGAHSVPRSEHRPPSTQSHYNLRHDEELGKLTTARTLKELQDEVTAEYLEFLPNWDQEAHNGARPPYAFSEAWWKHDFSLSFASKYTKLKRIVTARQAEDLIKNRVANPPPEPMDAEPAAADPAVIELDDSELVDPDELLGEAFQAQASINTLPPPSTVPSRKPTRSDTAHSVVPSVPSTSRKDNKERKTVASLKKRRDKSPARSRKSSAGSKRSHEPTSKSCPPAKEARRESPPKARSVSPNMARHLERVKTTKYRHLVPIIDGYVSKDMAVYMAMNNHQPHQWIAYYLELEGRYELLGLINHFGVPASYLPAKYATNKSAGTHTPLANLTYDQLRTEKTILPWNFILTSTIGALPAYWRQCNDDIGKHLRKALQDSSKYRDFKVSAIGPTGIDLRGRAPNDVKEYEEQRLNFVLFARLAKKLEKGLVVVIQYDKDPAHKESVHVDAINTLLEAGLQPNQRIHLIVSRASALELTLWIESFPRTLLSFDLYFLGGVRQILSRPNPNPQDMEYLQAYAMQDFLKYVPLTNIAFHSGCPFPVDHINGRYKTPIDIPAAARELQMLTETRTEVLHANNAKNLVWFYNLDRELLNRSCSSREHRDLTIGPRLSVHDLSVKIRALYPGLPARRAAQPEQERSERRSRSRTRSLTREDRHRRERSPNRHRSPSKKSRAEQERRRLNPAHSVGRSTSKHPAEQRPRSSSRAHQRRSSPKPTNFVVNMDLSSPANKPAEQPDQLKPKPLRLCDVKRPTRPPPQLDIPSGSRLEGRVSRPSSRLEGRVARGGEILPTEPTVRETIRTLKETYGEAERATVREQLERMRLNQERRADQLRQQLAREAQLPPPRPLMDEDPAHSVGSDPSHSYSAPSVEPVTTTVTCPHPDLLRQPPMLQLDMLPDEMSNEEIYQETLKLFDGEPTPNFGRRPLHPINLASSFIQPAQSEIFEVPDPAGEPPQNPFDPYYECNGVDRNGFKEHNLFHRHVGALDIVASRRWNSPYITGSDELKEMLKQIKKMHVRAPIQIMYIKYATRLKGNHRTRTPNALRFIHAVLTAYNLRHELPLLLSRFQPLITDRHTTHPWPTPVDYRNAMEHWSCYCVNAAIYAFNHLSGPIVFNSDWLEDPNVPLDLVMSFGDILKDDRQDLINDFRHQVYRQFGYAHIQAILQGDPKFTWKRFEDVDSSKLDLGFQTVLHTVLITDHYIYRMFGANLKANVQVIVLDLADKDAMLAQLIEYHFHTATSRIVFWLGPDYIVHRGDGYCFVMASLCYHISAYFGTIEQYVVLPSYVRNERARWSNNVLATYHRRSEIMPYARVVIDPQDVRHWERDERDLRQNDRLEPWDSDKIDEDGYYHQDFVPTIKWYLTEYHELDLWDADTTARCETTSAMSQMAIETSTSDHHQTSSASGSRSTNTFPDFQLPSTSSFGAHSVPGLDLDSVAMLLAQLIPQGTSEEERAAAIAAAMSRVTKTALSRAAETSFQNVQPKVDIIREQIKRAQQSSKKPGSKKEDHRGSRQDKDREQRK